MTSIPPLRSLRLASLIALTAAGACAQAQQVGSYSGTTDDGRDIVLHVAQLPDSGGLYISYVGTSFQAECRITRQVIGFNATWSGAVADLVDGHGETRSSGLQSFLGLGVTFTPDSTEAHGRVRSSVSALVPPDTPPRVAQVCEDKFEHFRVRFDEPTAARVLPRSGLQFSTRLGPGGQVLEESRRVLP